MTDLRTAAQLALKSMEKATRFMSDSDYKKLNHAIEVLKDALAEHDKCMEWYRARKANWDLQRQLVSETKERDRQRQEEALQRLTDVQQEIEAAPAAPEEDPELCAALGWVGGISEPVLDRVALLRRVAELAQNMQAKTKRAWDVGYDSGLKAASEFAAERRLNDAEIGEIWFNAKMPGVTETQARLLIRAAEAKLKDNHE
jgi:hypothetical protein